MVDVHILLKNKVYTDLICLKDFDSDILVHKLTFTVLSKIWMTLSLMGILLIKLSIQEG